MARVADRARSAEAPRHSRPQHRVQRDRRWSRRVLIGLCVFTSVCLVVVLGGWGYLNFQVSKIRRVAVPAISTPGVAGGPENILVVGSDSRQGLPSGAASHFGGASLVQGQRSDVIFIVHLVPATEQASILSIPRDTYVPLAGTRGRDRINSAFSNGPNQLVATIQNDFLIPINHYVEVNFQGFQGIVDSVGGIQMFFPYAVRDRMSGLKQAAGCQQLNGGQALSVARSRDYEYLANGYWQSDGTGDLGRIQRQHTFLRIMMQKAISVGIHNPITANGLISSTVNDVTIDSSFSTSDLVQLALNFKGLAPSAIADYVMPTSAAVIGGADVLLPVRSQAQAVVATFLNSGAAKPAAGPAPTPGSVPVRVLNGSGVRGQAGLAVSGLKALGFTGASDGGNAARYTYSQSLITYPANHQSDAQLVQSYVVGGATIQEDDSLSGSQVQLITGQSFGGVKAGASSGPAAAPSTSAIPTPAAYPAWDPTACPIA